MPFDIINEANLDDLVYDTDEDDDECMEEVEEEDSPQETDSSPVKNQVAEQLAMEKMAAEKLAAEKVAEKKAVEKKATEKKAAEKKAAEKKAVEKKAAEQKAAEKKTAEKKAAEQKAAEKKAAEQKAAEQKAAEKKAVEKKAAEQKAAEKKAAEKKAAKRLVSEKAAGQKRARPDDEISSKVARTQEASPSAPSLIAREDDDDVFTEAESVMKEAEVAYQDGQTREAVDFKANLSRQAVEKIAELKRNVTALKKKNAAQESAIFGRLDAMVEKADQHAAAVDKVLAALLQKMNEFQATSSAAPAPATERESDEAARERLLSVCTANVDKAVRTSMLDLAEDMSEKIKASTSAHRAAVMEESRTATAEWRAQLENTLEERDRATIERMEGASSARAAIQASVRNNAAAIEALRQEAASMGEKVTEKVVSLHEEAEEARKKNWKNVIRVQDIHTEELRQHAEGLHKESAERVASVDTHIADQFGELTDVVAEAMGRALAAS